MIRRTAWSVAFIPIMLSGPASAQLSVATTSGGCIAVRGAGAAVTVEGRLTLRHMPGPPNFESIRHGDEDRLTLILVLSAATCLDDGGDFADPAKRFNTVHVWTLDPAVRRQLRILVGKIITVTGEGYAADNALHYAPLVLEAKSVTRSR